MLITDWIGLIVSLLLPHIVPDHKPPSSDPLRTWSEKRLLNVPELGRVAEPMRPHPAYAARQVAYTGCPVRSCSPSVVVLASVGLGSVTSPGNPRHAALLGQFSAGFAHGALGRRIRF
jgi:hypothetical protein